MTDIIQCKSEDKAYNKIAERFNKTRSTLWKFTKDWYTLISKEGSFFIILDAGCGNGRNMIKPHMYIGLDSSYELLNDVTFLNCQTVCASVSNIPFPDNYFDHTLCISVIHHISSNEERLQIIRELIRVTKIGGYICIGVWYPPHYAFAHLTDVGDHGKLVHQTYAGTDIKRLFYIFDKEELFDICNTMTNVKVIEHGIYKQANYIFLQVLQVL